jgi:hypothetical protein
MRRALAIYAYAAPAVLTPLSFVLWRREYAGKLELVAGAWLVPILWAYIVPGIGTNVLKVWEFDARLRLGRYRPHHGFVFGSATAMIAWLAHGAPAHDVAAVLRCSLVMALVLGAVNLVYDIVALRAGILRVYNQPWAQGKPATSIALDYAPWFFGGFGAIYGAGIGVLERLDASGALSPSVFALTFALMLIACSCLPAAGYAIQSRLRHGHWGTRPVKKACASA